MHHMIESRASSQTRLISNSSYMSDHDSFMRHADVCVATANSCNGCAKHSSTYRKFMCDVCVIYAEIRVMYV